MKKTFTKSLALLLAVLMLMTAMPMGVFADDACTHWDYLVNHPKNDATKNADGNVAYWHCTHCEKNFAKGTNGPDFTKVLSDEDVILHFFPADRDYDKNKPGNADQEKEDATGKSGNIYYKKCANCNVYSETLTYEDDVRTECTPADEWTVPAGADCTVKGFTKKKLCTVCGKSIPKYDEIVSKGDHADVNLDVINPTCQKVGHKGGVYCTNCCKYLQGGEVIEKKAHEITTLEKRVEPTCTTAGSEEMKDCKMCHGKETLVGGRYVNNEPVANTIPKLGHELVDVTKRARTCLEDGYTSDGRICSRCKLVFTPKGSDIIDDAPGKHNPEKVLERAATTSSRGWVEHYKCTNTHTFEGKTKECGQLFLQEKDARGVPKVDPTTGKPVLREATEAEVYLKPTDHTHKEYKDTKLSKDGDCLTDGRLVIKCEICGETLKDEKIVASGHKWKWVEGAAATCSQAGTQYEKCTVCGATRGTPVPSDKKPHSWKLEKAADCTKGGKALYKCEVCGATEEREITKQTKHTDGDDNGVCDVCETKFCTCICHNHAWYAKILLFFVQVWWQFLGIRQNCVCGLKVHYVKTAAADVPTVT